MKLVFIALALIAIIVAGAFLFGGPTLMQVEWKPIATGAEYWINRYQTFLGVIVAVGVAWLTINAMSRQNDISERQFLSGQVQNLLGDRAVLQFVIAQLQETKSQKQIFWNNIAFLNTEGDKSVGWQNGPNLIRTAYGNVENFRNLVSANTAKFMGPTGTRSELVAKLDAIVASQDSLGDAFYKWAYLNRDANADPTAPASPEKVAFLAERDAILQQFDGLLAIASNAATELEIKSTKVESDISSLQALIASKGG